MPVFPDNSNRKENSMADSFMSQEEIDSLLSMAENNDSENSNNKDDIEVPDLRDLPDTRRVSKVHRWHEPQMTQKVTKYVSPVIKCRDIIYNPSRKETGSAGKIPVYRIFDFKKNSA
jgi:hypothetical protein